MSVQNDLERWHKALARVVGSLSLALSLRKISSSKMAGWAKVLEDVLKEMKQ